MVAVEVPISEYPAQTSPEHGQASPVFSDTLILLHHTKAVFLPPVSTRGVRLRPESDEWLDPN